MSKEKSYDTIQYYGQVIRNSLSRLLKDRCGGYVAVTQSHNTSSDTDIIEYDLYGMHTKLMIYRVNEVVHLDQEIGFGSRVEHRTEQTLKIKRGRSKRMSNADGVAIRSLENLKEFYIQSKSDSK